MSRLGFSDQFYKLIYQFLLIVSCSILLNDSKFDHISLSIENYVKGDPLPPYLFIIATEALSRMTIKSEAQQHFFGIQISRN